MGLLDYKFLRFIETQDCLFFLLVVRHNDNVPLVLEYRMKLHMPTKEGYRALMMKFS